MKDESEKQKSAVNGAPADLRARTKQFALRIIRLYCALPNTAPAQVMGKQVLRCGTSVGTHYREGFRARSTAEFVSKLEGGLQELDEASYWLELLVESGTMSQAVMADLMKEADELIAILVTCAKNAKDK